MQGALYGVAGCCRSGAEVTTHLPGIWRHDGGGWARSDGGYFDDVRVTDALRIGNSVYGLRCVGHGLWPDGRLYVARTGGVAWSDDATAEPVVWHESAGLESVTFFRAAPNPVQTALVWTGTWGNDIGVSSDGGATLTSLRNGLETLSILDILWHATPGQVTVATIEGLYRSDDGGQSWFKLPGPLALQPVYALHQADGGTLLAGAADGLWLSQDDGATWQHVPELADHPAMRLGRADSPQAPKRRLSHLPAPAHVGII